MYPKIPNENLSWPITQHAGIINKDLISKLLLSCISLNGVRVDSELINKNILSLGILTENLRSDSNKIDAWRDYQQILSELGLIYSTIASNRILILTPIALAFLDGNISYEELITLQILRYQYPNGHKTQLSSAFKNTLPHNMRDLSFTQIQYSYGIKLRPAVLIFQILTYLLKHGHSPYISTDELQTYAVRCLTNSDATECSISIIRARNGEINYKPLPRARRNMQDWIKLLSQSPLFHTSDFRYISLSDFSKKHIDECNAMIESLLNQDSYWELSLNRQYKLDWFSFYGNISLDVDLINFSSHEFTYISSAEKNINLNDGDQGIIPTTPNLKLYRNTTRKISSTPIKVISQYDYRTSQKGYFLHDSMVDFIARRCSAKGAEVYEDRNTVDLFIKFREREYLIEVKSITTSNFINRLRIAIGQIKQYDYLIQPQKPRRLGIAFTAEIPSSSWVIPFVTSHLKMDLLTMSKDNLKIHSLDEDSLYLFNP